MKSKDLPIGYWIKQADNLLTQGINNIQAECGLSRTDWQILNTVNEKQRITQSELISLMQPFADNHTLKTTLLQLVKKELIAEQDFFIQLTITGKQIWQECLRRQIAFREQSMQYITEAAYQTTVATLQQLVNNLNHT